MAAFPFAKYAHYNDLGVFAVMTILFHYRGRLRFSLEREREREREKEREVEKRKRLRQRDEKWGNAA